MRKPKPLGTEFKKVVDELTGMMLWLEIQEGKDRMCKLTYNELEGTATYVMRGVENTSKFRHHPSEHRDNVNILDDTQEPYLYFGDSWFGSMKSAVQVRKAGYHTWVKTTHDRSLNKDLDENVKDYPGGTWTTIEGRCNKDGVDLICIGYKYNKKKVPTFVLTKEAGTTRHGEPHEARFPDKFGNICIRHVARPAIIFNYFKFSNVIDVHNQA